MEHVAVQLKLLDASPAIGSRISVSCIIEIFENALDAPEGVLLRPEQGDRKLGLHQVRFVGFSGTGTDLKFANSWGEGWGDDGFGSISEDYFESHATEAWLFRRGDDGHDLPGGFEPFNPRLTPKQLERAWRRKPPHGGKTISPGLRFRWYRVSSLSNHAYTFVGEVVHSTKVRAGWCHVEVGTSKGEWTAIVSELFVWPSQRGKGVARYLLEWARDVAREWRCVTFQVLVREADVVTVNALPHEAIARSLGLAEWHQAPVDGQHGIAAIAGEYL